ncbi:MAG: penicillin-binding protein 2 [Candidatus Pacebacteria bacterium]|nr:penicillin-binding protein 2 [Candidatus Paceibacterota bacterium]
MKKIHVSRIGVLYAVIIIAAFVLLSKLFVVQVMHGSLYKQEAGDQYVAYKSYIFDRGSIYFEKKDGTRISAATLRSGYTLVIDPSNITDAEAVYNQLSKIVEIDKDTFFARADKKDDPYEEISKRLDSETKKKIEELEIEGVFLVQEKWRFYPADELASHTLGFVGYKEDVLAGRYGLERFYDDILRRGENKLYVNFFAEVFSNVSNLLKINSRNNREGDVVTTIDPSVQQTLRNTLQDLREKWDAEVVGGIVIDPQTGFVYGLSAYPDFDPNSFNTVEDQAVFSNPLVEKVYEMGSIVKPLTMAIGLDLNKVRYDSTYNDKGYVILNEARIENYDGKGRGVVSMQEVLNQSLNTGAVHVMQEVGKDKFREYMYAFGMADRSGVDLPNDTRGLARNLESKYDIEYATVSFGQGIAITPFTMVRALSTLANGGLLITPRVVKEIDYAFGFPQELDVDEPKRVLKPETSDEISRMLVEVVDSALLGGTVKMDGYSIAAKTGTAQIADPEGGYHDDKYLHSFFGYFPAYDPRFLVFLYTVDPKEVRYASQTLTFPFMDMTKFLINYYNIPPDR